MKDVMLYHQYDQAAEIIKTAILQTQYEAARDINRIQLGLYFGIGRFLSEKTRNAKWGTNALQSISDKLKSDLPGLRGFSATQLKDMRMFYEAWSILDSISSVATDEIQASDIDVDNHCILPSFTEIPIDDFLRIPFTHHSKIISKVKEIEARYYYIHRTAEEHLSVEQLKKIIRDNDFENRAIMPNNFPKTISNSFFDTSSEMPDELRKALPDVEELKKLL